MILKLSKMSSLDYSVNHRKQDHSFAHYKPVNEIARKQRWRLPSQFSPFCYFLNFQNNETLVTNKISRSYLTVVIAAELHRHLTNMNAIERI